MSGEQSTQQDPRRITARQILGKWPVWVFPSVLVTLLSFVLSLVYTGGIADPQGSMRHLPIALINHDTGPWGKQFVQAVATAPDPGRRVSWRIMSPAEAKDAFDSGRVYGGVDVPRDFSSSLQAIIATPARAAAATGVRHPQVTLLTNPGAGSLASSLATGVEQQALRVSSQKVGADLKAQLRATGAQPTPAQLMLLGNPIASTTAPGHRIGARTGLGLTAFYLTLLFVLSGFLGANIVSNSVDAALGYAPSELGPKRRMRSPLLINRTQTLVIKMVMSAALSMVTSSAIVLATAVIIRLDLPHLLQLWVFAVCASAVVGISAQTILAAFGGLGQVISMFFFVALSIPSAGATVPLEALPGFYRVLALFEPMRQIGGGTRAIIYFDARADAGLQRAWIMLGVGLAVALVLGFGITRFYDKRGYHRVHPDHIQSPRS